MKLLFPTAKRCYFLFSVTVLFSPHRLKYKQEEKNIQNQHVSRISVILYIVYYSQSILLFHDYIVTYVGDIHKMFGSIVKFTI